MPTNNLQSLWTVNKAGRNSDFCSVVRGAAEAAGFKKLSFMAKSRSFSQNSINE